MDAHGKVALVTGGASGLGEATTRALVARGAKVLIVDRSEEQGRALAGKLGASAAFAPADVTDEVALQAAISQARTRFGALHVAIGCAGVATAGRVIGKSGLLPLEAFQKTINVNLVGMFNLLRLAAGAMVENDPEPGGERGVIVTTASIAAYDGQVGQTAYSASKAGVVGMTLPAARELARFGIRVVTIAPGTFDTPMLAGLPEEARKALASNVPFPSRLGRPAEFAALVLHVVENAMVNGEAIRLDAALRMPPQ